MHLLKNKIIQALGFILIAIIILCIALNGGSISDLLALPKHNNDIHIKNFVSSFLLFNYIFTVLTICIIRIKPIKDKIHWMFSIVAISSGLLYSFAITPIAPADEHFHYKQTLSYSSYIFGFENLDTTSNMNMFSEHKNSSSGYSQIGRIFEPHDVSKKMTFSPADFKRKGNIFMYLPQVLGIAIAQLLGVTPLVCFYIGRIFALISYVAIVTIAIWLAPAFKKTLAVVALCPMAIAHAASYSYDSATLTGSFLCFGAFLRITQSKPNSFDWKCALPILIILSIGVAIKSLAMPYISLLFIIPAMCYKDGIYGKCKFITLAILITIISIFLTLSVAPNAVRDLPLGTLYNGQKAYQISDVILHPLHTIHLIFNTINSAGISYVLGAFGQYLAAFSIQIPLLCILGFIILFIYTAKTDNRYLMFSKSIRIASAIGILILTSYLFIIMMVTWTHCQSNVIAGLQGRYWTPILPLFTLLFFAKDSSLKLEHESQSNSSVKHSFLIFYTITLLHFAVLTQIIKITLLEH